jgi:hypothetical protein
MKDASILLQSKDRFVEVAELDPGSGTARFRTKRSADLPQGSYAQVNGTFCALYRRDGILMFRFGDAEFPLHEAVYSELLRSEDVSTLRLHYHGRPLFELSYPRTAMSPPLDADLTPFVEEEDFAFPLFVHNVLSDPERRELIFRS